MIAYPIKAMLCALFFLVIYISLFEKEDMHRFKRIFLLGSLALSMVVPLITLQWAVPPVAENLSHIYQVGNLENGIPVNTAFPAITNPTESQKDTPLPVDYVFWVNAFSATVTVILLLRIIWNMLALYNSTKKGKCIVFPDKKIVLVKEKINPHSFGAYIYINEEEYNNGLIADEIVRHEQAHVEQKHSLDIVFIEILIALCWFNPVLYFYRRKIKQNHEFLADQFVLQHDIDVSRYQNILIGMISRNGSAGLASSINYSTIKKRFIMMTRKTSSTKAWCRKALLIPAIAASVCLFSTQMSANNPLGVVSEKNNQGNSANGDFIVFRKGVPVELVKEYEGIVGKYISEKTDNGIKWKSSPCSDADVKRLYTIYVQMDSLQRRQQLIWFAGPFTPSKFRFPNKDEWNAAKRANVVWFNGRKMDVSCLDKYTRRDIYFFINCYVDENRKIYQSALWTKDGYKAYMEHYKDGIMLPELLAIIPQTWVCTNFTPPKIVPEKAAKKRTLPWTAPVIPSDKSGKDAKEKV